MFLKVSEFIPQRQELITNPSNVISRIEDFVGVEPYLTEDKMGFRFPPFCELKAPSGGNG